MDGKWTQRIGALSSRAMIEPEHDAEFERAAARILGSTDIPGCLRMLAGHAWIAAAMFPLFMRHDTVYVEPDLAAKAVLLSSAVNDCRYSYGFFRSRMLLSGYPGEELDRLTEAAVDGADSVGDREQALVDLVKFTSLCDPLESGGNKTRLFSRLKASGLSKQAIGELAGCIAQCGFFNRVCTLLAAPPYVKAETMPEKVLIRAVRPILSRSIRGRRIEPIDTPKPRGPFAPVLKGLQGTWYLPWATTLIDRCLDDQTVADGLPIATRLAIVVTVSETLRAPGIGSEARDLLVKRSGEGLPDMLAAWCTMSVSYRAREAIEHTERISKTLGSSALADAVATSALANLLARLERFNA